MRILSIKQERSSTILRDSSVVVAFAYNLGIISKYDPIVLLD